MGKIQEFYEGQCIFLTGGTGFLGKILYEKLLRDVPGVRKIYLLIRRKKGHGPEERLHRDILSSPLFNVLKDQLGVDFEEVVRKTVPVEGDILQDNLGMDQATITRLASEVTVVMHCAATISFIEPIRDAFDQNVMGCLRVLELAKKCTGLRIFTHISTAYTGCHRKGMIEEDLHPLHFDPEQLMRKLIPMTTEEAEKMSKKILGKYPNTYTVTKSMAEHLLVARRGSMPMVFCRPAIIGGICRDPIPGFIDTLAAAGGLYAAIGTGLMTFLPGHPQNVGDQVPADFVANNIIVSTALNADQDKLSIYHVGTSHKNPLRWIDMKDHLFPYWLYYPPEQRFGSPNFEFITTPYMFEFNYFLRWVVPTVVYKIFAHTIQDREHIKQANLLALWESRMVKIIEVFRHFIENSWVFAVDNSDELLAQMDQYEKEVFNFDATNLQWYPDYLLNYCYGLRIYVLNEKGLRRPWINDSVDLRFQRKLFGDIAFAWGKDLRINNKNINRTPTQMRAMVLASARVQEAIRLEAESKQVSLASAEDRANGILDLMSAEASPAVMRTLAWVFRKVYRRLYSAVLINETGMDAMKTIVARGSPLVLVPTHRSYVDFLILSYICYAFSVPVPHIASVDDFLNVVLVRWIFRHSGAFYMRRSFHEDQLYQTIFAEYTRRLLYDGYPVEFFIEGTRSRTGKMMHPKDTLLSVVAEGYLNGPLEDIELVPISLSYEKVFESGSYMAELLGERKKTKPSLTALLRAAKWALTVDFGRINVQIGDTISMHSFTESFVAKKKESGLPFDPFSSLDDKTVLIAARLRDNGVCMSPSIVAMMILFGRNGMRKDHLIDQYDQFREEIQQRGGWIDPLAMPPKAIVNRALRLLHGLVVQKNSKCLVRMGSPTDHKNWLHLSYYKNQVVHLFYHEGMVACALASFGKQMYDTSRGVAHEELFKRTQYLHSLFKYEFVPSPIDYNNTFDFMVDERVLGRIRDGQEDRLFVSPRREKFFVQLCTMFWPFIDTYWLSSLSLLSAYPRRKVKLSHLVDRAQTFAVRFYEEHLIEHYESNSRESIENVLRVFIDKGILAVKQFSVKSRQPVVVLCPPFCEDEAKVEDLVASIGKFRKSPLRDVGNFHGLMSLL